MSKILIGCIADDFTGASDAASLLAANGLKTVMTCGVPESTDWDTDAEAIVIATKTRSMEPFDASRESLNAVRWLKKQKVGTFYYKYCSTFDSTRRGNIGPVTDALLNMLSIPYTVMIPSMLENGRTVRDGILYVNGVPLAESHMKSHPINPMWDSYLPKLVAPQSKYPCFVLTEADLNRPEETRQQIDSWQAQRRHFHIAVDYWKPEHGAKIMEFFHDLPLLTGGSGILADFARYHKGEGCAAPAEPLPSDPNGRLMLAGSCSQATRAQVSRWLESGGKGIELDPEALLSGEQTVEAVWQQVCENRGEDILVYSCGSYRKEPVSSPECAAVLEKTIAELAGRAVEAGLAKRIVVAGGETSGAVVQRLTPGAFRIGPSVAPGVPEMTPLTRKDLRIVLKSGNFGAEDFFLTALNR